MILAHPCCCSGQALNDLVVIRADIGVKSDKVGDSTRIGCLPHHNCAEKKNQRVKIMHFGAFYKYPS